MSISPNEGCLLAWRAVLNGAEGIVRQRRQSYRGETLARQLRRVLVSRPEFFAITEARNPFCRQHSNVDISLALAQWEKLCDAFRRAGLEVNEIEPRFGLEDMCFASSQAFVGVDAEDRSFAVLSRMLNRSRRDEVDIFARWYSHQGYRIIDLSLEGEEFIEGAGDLIWNPDWQYVWAGYGHRSTRAAVDLFAGTMEEMGFAVRKLELVDPHFYHLSICMAPLTPDSLLLYPGAFAPQTLAQIRGQITVHEVAREDALRFVCNGVSVNGYYITARLSRRLEQILGEEGIEPIVVELSEFHKAGGSVASLKMLLP
jgi:N-dimethylarginine dimethylaminohydrolase